LHQFYAERKSKDGYRSACKRCLTEAQGKVYVGKRNKDLPVPDGFKRCRHCEQILPKTEFFKAAEKSDGLQSWCKACRYSARERKNPPRERVPDGMKRCYKCQQLQPATLAFFSADKRSPGGLQAGCKQCFRAYREQNRERINQQKHEYYVRNAERINAANMHHYYARRDHYLEKNLRWYYTHQNEVREYRKAYYEENRERLLASEKARRAKHPERWQAYYHKNKHRINASQRAWAEANRPIIRTYAKIGKARRRARKRQLPYDWSVKYWRVCLAYWDHRCCVCGQTEHLQADHWIALTHADCPGTTVGNMIVLCRSCNATKG